MSQATRLGAQIATIDELHSVVTAMRSLAAGQVQAAEHMLPGIHRYAEIIRGSLVRARALMAPDDAADAAPEIPSRFIVVCSERGFVGTFNERLLDRAASELEAKNGHLWIVGARGIQLAHERRLAIEYALAMSTHAAGVFVTARELAAEVERRLARGELGRLMVLGARHAPGELAAIELRQLLPLRLELGGIAPPTPRPLHHLPALELFARVVREHVAGELVRVVMESFASENAARLQAMEAARHHIEDRLHALRTEADRTRQEGITSELLDVITGAEAVRG